VYDLMQTKKPDQLLLHAVIKNQFIVTTTIMSHNLFLLMKLS